MARFRILIVDDEVLARWALRHLLQLFQEVEITGEASSATEALEALREQEFDAVFLDINMPGGSGLNVAEVLRHKHPRPYVAFVTAYEEFAIRAFQLEAHDYLLKPIDEQRLAMTVNRLKEHVASQTSNLIKQSVRTIHDLYPVRASGTNIRLVPFGQIVAFQAERQYIRVHTRTESFLCTTTSLGEMETIAPNPPFLRVHRSFLVNLREIRHIQVVSRNRYELEMVNPRLAPIPISRRSLASFRLALGL